MANIEDILISLKIPSLIVQNIQNVLKIGSQFLKAYSLIKMNEREEREKRFFSKLKFFYL